jgi:vacuolar protein sorting-associated protein 29
MKKENANQDNIHLILITGDLHIPTRGDNIHEEIKKVLSQKKFQYILSPGNIGNKESYDYIKSLCTLPNTNVHIVKGESLEENTGSSNTSNSLTNEIKTIKIEDFIITIINGGQIVPWGDLESLASIQKQTGCDILISGCTHKMEVTNYEGKYFINAGSLTGAYSPLINDPTPSFMVMVISADLCILYSYEFDEKKKSFDIKKVEINKNRSE